MGLTRPTAAALAVLALGAGCAADPTTAPPGPGSPRPVGRSALELLDPTPACAAPVAVPVARDPETLRAVLGLTTITTACPAQDP